MLKWYDLTNVIFINNLHSLARCILTNVLHFSIYQNKHIIFIPFWKKTKNRMSFRNSFHDDFERKHILISQIIIQSLHLNIFSTLAENLYFFCLCFYVIFQHVVCRLNLALNMETFFSRVTKKHFSFDLELSCRSSSRLIWSFWQFTRTFCRNFVIRERFKFFKMSNHVKTFIK